LSANNDAAVEAGAVDGGDFGAMGAAEGDGLAEEVDEFVVGSGGDDTFVLAADGGFDTGLDRGVVGGDVERGGESMNGNHGSDENDEGEKRKFDGISDPSEGLCPL